MASRKRSAKRRSAGYETELWPYIEARWKGGKRAVPPRYVCIHTPEWPESSSGAEAVAAYFKTMPDGRKASATLCTDNDSIVQSVYDSVVPYAAGPTGNREGLHIEITGYAYQTRAQWRDKYSLAALAIAADATAQYCLKYGFPVKQLSVAEVKDGRSKGITDHATVTAAYRESTHNDPGPNFPWRRFMGYVQAAYEDRNETRSTSQPSPRGTTRDRDYQPCGAGRDLALVPPEPRQGHRKGRVR